MFTEAHLHENHGLVVALPRRLETVIAVRLVNILVVE
jgi:hypothetical protein